MQKRFTFFQLFIATLGSIFLFGQFANSQELEKLPSPQKWTTHLTEPQELGRINDLDFITSRLTIRFRVFPNVLSFALRNWSEDTLFVLWNDCEFAIEKEAPTGVVHSKLRFGDRNRPLTYQSIAPAAEAKFFIAPRSRADWNNEIQKWRSFPIYEGNPKTMVGKTFGFHLMLQDGRGKKKFPFVFHIDEVEGISWKDMEKELSKSLTSPTPEGKSLPQIESPSLPEAPTTLKEVVDTSTAKKTEKQLIKPKKDAPHVSARIKEKIRDMEETMHQEFAPSAEDSALYERISDTQSTIDTSETTNKDSLASHPNDTGLTPEAPKDASEILFESTPTAAPPKAANTSKAKTKKKKESAPPVWIKRGTSSF